MGGCHRISVPAPAIRRTCSGDSIIAMGMPDEGSCRTVVGGNIADEVEIKPVVGNGVPSLRVG